MESMTDERLAEVEGMADHMAADDREVVIALVAEVRRARIRERPSVPYLFISLLLELPRKRWVSNDTLGAVIEAFELYVRDLGANGTKRGRKVAANLTRLAKSLVPSFGEGVLSDTP